MRFRGLFLLLLLALAGCVGPGQRRAVHRPPSRPTTTESPAALRQCLADLGATGAKYQPLPDRSFGNGCSAIGTVKLLAVGIPITNLGALTCRAADKLSLWTQEAVQSAAKAWLDSPVVKIESFGTYNCRPIDGKAGAKLSQHALANAVDIAAFDLASGRRITVLEGWRGPDANVRNFLRAVFKAGCRRFAIGLSPDSDGYHQNHFHFDMGPNGPYCH